MSKILLSTAYFPPINYMAMLASGNAELEAHESYSRQSYRNRCSIPAANGRIVLTVPVDEKEKAINNIHISYKENWQKQHWRTITSAYNNSPYFSHYAHNYEPYFNSKTKSLFDFNCEILAQLCKDLHVELPVKTERWIKSPENTLDLRTLIHPKKSPVIPVLPYYQVFSDKYPFEENSSVIDLLFNLGPDAGEYLRKCYNNYFKF